MCKHKQMQAISLALGIETLTACVSIGWGAWEGDRGVTDVRACDGQRHKGPHGGFRLLSPGVAQLTWQNSMQLYSILMHVKEVMQQLPFSRQLTPANLLLELML